MFKIGMENIINYSKRIDTVIVDLKTELHTLRRVYDNIRIKTLNEENTSLNKRVEETKALLIRLETARGIKQISTSQACGLQNMKKRESTVPGEKNELTSVKEERKEITSVPADKIELASVIVQKSNLAKKEKRKTEQVVKPKAQNIDILPVDVGRLDLRIGKILQVEKHPDADSLYVSKVECGDSSPRTVVSGLVKFVPIDELHGKKVVVLCNLKPVKMRGVTSEAMIMCASTPETVEVLCPPDCAEPGNIVECEGYVRQPDTQLNPKKKIFETVAPDLKTNKELYACYMGKPLLVCGQKITTKSLCNVQIK